MTNKAFLVRDGLRSGSTLVINSGGTWVGNTITEIYGGTNQTSYAEGDILFASGSNTLAKLTAAGNGDVLTLAGGVPSWATPAAAPNSFGFVTGDIGSPSVIANTTSDVLQITGGAGISTSVTGSPAVLVITNDSPNVDQNLWLSIAADSGGPVSANTTSDTLTLAGGTNIASVIAGDQVTFNWSAALGDLSDVTAVGSPTGQLLYSDGTNWAALPKGTNGQVLTMGSPLFPVWTANLGQPDQDIWLNINADSGGPVAANTTSDTLTFTGGTSITTSISGDVLTITNDDPNVDQNIWLNINADSGAVAANTTSDTLVLAGGTGIITAISGDTVTTTLAIQELSVTSISAADWIAFDDAGTSSKALVSGIDLALFNNSASWAPDQNLWLNIDADSGGPVAANTTSDTFTIIGGTSITTSISGDALTITNDDPNVDQNIWLNIAADSGGPVAANATNDTLTLTGGDGIDSSITGDAVTFDVDVSVARMDAGSPASHLNVGAFTVDTVNLGAIGTLTTSTLTTTSQSQVAVASFAIATYRSAEFTIQAVQGTNFHTTKLLAVHDGTLADSTEYGTITLPSFFGSPAAGSPAISGEQATYAVDINGGDLRLLATPTTTSSTVFKVTAQLTTV